MITSRRQLFKLIGAAALLAAAPVSFSSAPAIAKPETWRKHFDARMARTILVNPEYFPVDSIPVEQEACLVAHKQMMWALHRQDEDQFGYVRREPTHNVHHMELLASIEKLEAMDAAIVSLISDIRDPDDLSGSSYEHLETYFSGRA